MDTPLKVRPGSAARAASGPGYRSAVLGTITIPGSPEEVTGARGFIARVLSAAGGLAASDAEAAILLTSELVTNAIQHTASGEPGGTVTVVVIIEAPGGVLVEVIDDGSADVPVVKGDLLTPDGHGLYLVERLAAQWGYLRDAAGTAVWFRLSGTAAARTRA